VLRTVLEVGGKLFLFLRWLVWGMFRGFRRVKAKGRSATAASLRSRTSSGTSVDAMPTWRSAWSTNSLHAKRDDERRRRKGRDVDRASTGQRRVAAST
jgi:hypothetical protein